MYLYNDNPYWDCYPTFQFMMMKNLVAFPPRGCYHEPRYSTYGVQYKPPRSLDPIGNLSTLVYGLVHTFTSIRLRTKSYAVTHTLAR